MLIIQEKFLYYLRHLFKPFILWTSYFCLRVRRLTCNQLLPYQLFDFVLLCLQVRIELCNWTKGFLCLGQMYRIYIETYSILWKWHVGYNEYVIITWLDQKVLKQVPCLLKYTTEIHTSYTEYVTTISWLIDVVRMTQYNRRYMTSSFDDVIQQWPGVKNVRNCLFPA